MYTFEHAYQRIHLRSSVDIQAGERLFARLTFQFTMVVMAHIAAYGCFALQPNLPNAGVTLFDSRPPTIGVLVTPAAAAPGSVIQVTYSGVNDGDGSGIGEVELWARPQSMQTWGATGQKRTFGSGTFSYTLPANERLVQFALRTRDVVGNSSALPTGDGTATTIVVAENGDAVHVILGEATAAINEVASVGIDLSSTTPPDSVSFEVHFDSVKLAFLSGNQAQVSATYGDSLSIDEPSPGNLSIAVAASSDGGIQNGRLVDLSLTVLPVAESSEVLWLDGTSLTAIIAGQSPETVTISDGEISVYAKSVPGLSGIGLVILIAMVIIMPFRQTRY